MTVIDTHIAMHVEQTSAADQAAPAQSPSASRPAFPLVSIGLLAAMAALFAAEIAFGIDDTDGLMNPSVRTLMAFGGLQYALVVGDGEWYRLMSAPLLHLNVMHILFNGVALYLAGRILEPMVGRLWFAALFVVGGIGGGLMSLAANPHNIVSVGASGAIMALFAAIYVLSFRLAEVERKTLQHRALWLLIPSLLPLANSHGSVVDYGAHFGGAIAGALASAALLAVWGRDSMLPALRNLAVAVVAAGVLAAGYAGIANARQYEVFALSRFLAPQAELPKGMNAIVAQSAALVDKHPRDPRARLLRAIGLVHDHDLGGAEAQMRLALSEHDILRTVMKPEYTTHLEAYLSLILSDLGRNTEARDMARAGCDDASADLHDNVVKAGLCGSSK